MKDWSFLLSPEERHLAKVGDLDGLEKIALASDDQIEVAMSYERIFEALDSQPKADIARIMDWGRRYLVWANRFTDRDGLPILGTNWAKRMFEIATAMNDRDVAIKVSQTILWSYAPREKEQRWWMQQHYHLTHNE